MTLADSLTDTSCVCSAGLVVQVMHLKSTATFLSWVTPYLVIMLVSNLHCTSLPAAWDT